MWFIALAVALMTFLLLLPTSQGASERPPAHAKRPPAPSASVRMRVPAGWRVVPRRLSSTTYPIPLMVASFAVHARFTCSCGIPHITDFPRNGAFFFAWEYTHLARSARRYFPPRPAHLRVPPRSRRPYGCGSPGWTTNFRVGQRAFQVEIYLGPRATAGTIAKMDALLASIKVVQGT